MNHSFSLEVEKFLYATDFSQGHKRSVWEKIRLRLQADTALSYSELDDVAGGLSQRPRKMKD